MTCLCLVMDACALRGKTVLITGAGSGIGKHLAETLSKFGCLLTVSVALLLVLSSGLPYSLARRCRILLRTLSKLW